MNEAASTDAGVATKTVPGVVPTGGMVLTMVASDMESLPVYKTVEVTKPGLANKAGVAITTVPGALPTGSIVVIGIGPVIVSLPVYRTVDVTNEEAATKA